MTVKIVISVILSFILFCSCTNTTTYSENLVKTLVGTELSIPDTMSCYIQSRNIDLTTDWADYKIITYIDSTGCAPCRMKLPSWNAFIAEILSLTDKEVAFLMILHSSGDEDISYALKRDNFLYPITYDEDGLFAEDNNLPESTPYTTFLLDGDNKIVLVGNPVLNPKLRDLYKKVIIEGSAKSEPILCERPVSALGVVDAGARIEHSFELDNRSDSALTIQDVIPSCDCMNVEFPKESILPGKTSHIKISFTADTLPGAFSRYINIFYKEKEFPEKLTLPGYITNNKQISL